MRNEKVRQVVAELKRGQTPAQVLLSSVISFVVGMVASAVIAKAAGWYAAIIGKLQTIQWFAWLEVPIISGHRWLWGDLALSVVAGFLVLIIVSVAQSLVRLTRRTSGPATPNDALSKAERLMPGLVAEMRSDLLQNPIGREFVLLKRSWTFNGDSLAYYYDDHPELDQQVQLLLSLGLIREAAHGNVKRYVMTEAFADHLSQRVA